MNRSQSDHETRPVGGGIYQHHKVTPIKWPRWLGYLTAIVLEGILTLGLLAIQPHFPLPRYPIPYVLVIMLVAYVFGEGPAILAFILGFVLFDYYFVAPGQTLLPHFSTASALAAQTAFLVGTSIVGISMLLIRRGRRRIESLLSRVEDALSERLRVEEALREAEAHKLDFYRRTIMAATAGKLVITDRRDIERTAGPALASWEVRRAVDLKSIRHEIQGIAESQGMDEDRMQSFILCVGEAITNAIKHADGGTTSIHATADSLVVMIEDQGSGIEALNLPDIALVPGYSSAGTLGMGYKAMIAFADKVYLATGPEGTAVAVEMKLRKPDGLPFAVPLDCGLEHARA